MMKKTKKTGKKLRVAIILILTFMFALTAVVVQSKSSSDNKFIIVIDAGHGGIDGGAVGITTKISESEINLSVSKKLKKYFENAGFMVVMTRETPMGLYGVYSKGFKQRDLNKRVEIANKSLCNVFISIHMNKYSNNQPSGAQVFYKDDASSKLLAKSVQSELDKIDDNKKDGNILRGDYFVLEKTKAISILCECGFLSSEKDEKRLVTDEYQASLAYSIFMGTMSYLISAQKA